MNKDDFFVKSQIASNIQNVVRLINTNVFNTEELRIFQEPVFVSIILKLDDFLQKFRILDHRLNFKKDVMSGDITDLINSIRDAICHLNSGENLLDKKSQMKFVFSMLIGRVNAIAIGDNVIAKSDYDDDVAFFYGENRLYLKRHIFIIITESKEIYKNLYGEEILIF